LAELGEVPVNESSYNTLHTNTLHAVPSKATRNDFFNKYLEVTSGTEVPTFFRRWSILTAVGAWIGRNAYFCHGDFKVYPNMYVMLLGAPGTRKSTAIKRAKKVLAHAGYTTFAAEKTTKEKFLLDLSGIEGEEDVDGFLDLNLEEGATECFIVADEFNDFFGNNIIDFVSLLGVLWDYEGTYKSKVKNGVSVEIPDPTISILGGNTQSTFANTFPPEVIGQGFFSRMVAVYSEPTSKKIAFPKAPDEDKVDELAEHLQAMRTCCVGELAITEDAVQLLEKIYLSWKPIEDERFAHYGNRRLGHLLKLIVIITVARLSQTIEKEDVTYANTILMHTEHFMPKAFGEFGRAKNASVSHKVLQIIETWPETRPIEFGELWPRVSNDLGDLHELGDIVRGLSAAGKIQVVDSGFLANKVPLDVRYDDMVDYSYLTNAEINGE
jgi:hypothetical protein